MEVSWKINWSECKEYNMVKLCKSLISVSTLFLNVFWYAPNVNEYASQNLLADPSTIQKTRTGLDTLQRFM